MISDIEIDKFMKGNLPKIPENTVIAMDSQKINEFMEQVRKNFSTISQDQFNWMQDIIPNLESKTQVDGHSLADHISNMFRSGFKHEQRNDLICHLRKDSVKQFYGIECFGGDAIKKINPDVFRGMNTKQISSLLQSSSVKFLTEEQKKVIIANNDINSELKKKLSPSVSYVTPMPSEAPLVLDLESIQKTSPANPEQAGGIFSESSTKRNMLPPIFENKKVNSVISPDITSLKTRGKTLSAAPKRHPKRKMNYVIRKNDNNMEELSLDFRSIKGGDDEDELVTNTENEMVAKISDHIKLMESLKDVDFPLENDSLNVDGVNISADCFMHFFTGSDDEVAARCDTAHAKIADYFDGEILDVSGMFDTNNEDRSLQDSLLRAREIYSFIVAVAKKTTDKDFRTDNIQHKHLGLKRLEDLIIEYFNFTHKLMQKYKVIDAKIVNAAEDMLYLYTNVIQYHTNVGKDLGTLNSTYADLVAVVDDNIGLYDGLQKGIVIGSENMTLTTNMSATVESLIARMAELKEQQDSLNENIKLINNETVRAGKYASDTMKNFVDTLY